LITARETGEGRGRTGSTATDSQAGFFASGAAARAMRITPTAAFCLPLW
jgi:hypothetical protein